MSTNILYHLISILKDTLSSRYHSKDFVFARSEYLRARISTVSLIFVLLTPLWALLDWALLPAELLPIIYAARILMFFGLLFTYLISKRPNSTTNMNLFLSGITLALPALFYAVVLISLSFSTGHSLIGYSFIPYLLVGMLSMFPFTLIESFVLGFGLLLLQLFSGFITNSAFDAKSLQDLWLLAALLCIVMASNHFHLRLLLRLYRQATHDPLTGLLNRVALERHTKYIEKLSPRPSTAIILMDLDHFKSINDKHGHFVGDQVLRLFAAMLKKEATHNQTVCRYGGEEFLIISTNCTEDEAIAKAEAIRLLTLELTPYTLDQDPFNVSVSQGVSMLRANETIQAAIQRADERLYQAKENGRNCVVATG